MSIYKGAIHCSFCLLINTDMHKAKFRCGLEPGLKSMSGWWRVYRSGVSCYSAGSWLPLWAWRLPSDLFKAGIAETPLGSSREKPREKPSLLLVACEALRATSLCRRDRMVAVVPGQFDDVDTPDRHLKPVKAWK